MYSAVMGTGFLDSDAGNSSMPVECVVFFSECIVRC